MKKCIVAVFILVVFFLLAGKSYAIEVKVKAGSFEIIPFVNVTEVYTDNVFATQNDTKSDFVTIISPGIKLLFPRVKRRYQLELKYQADIERFARFSSENAVSHTLGGKFGVMFPMGLELRADDEFRRAHDPRAENPLSPELDFYKDNLFHASAAYLLTDRFKLQLDYSNYVLTYDADRNNFRNYMSNALAVYAYYRFTRKVSAFVEYEHVIFEFDESAALNSREDHFFGGITWDLTGKTQGMIKAGYSVKDFDDSSIEGSRDFIFEMGVNHNLTSRDSIHITGSRATHETNLLGESFYVSTVLFAEYARRLTGKITGKANIGYAWDSYSGLVPKTDNIWTAGLSLSYQFKRWLLTEAGYRYTKRSSNVDAYNYGDSTVFFRIEGTL